MINWELYPDFSEKEFECKCGCGSCNVSEILVKMLQYARNASRKITKFEFGHSRGVSFRISSGCRCKKHNKKEGGSAKSSHITTSKKECTAVDLKIRTYRERYVINRSIILAGFNRYGLYKKHKGFHVDCDKTKKKGVFWLR